MCADTQVGGGVWYNYVSNIQPMNEKSIKKNKKNEKKKIEGQGGCLGVPTMQTK